MRDLLGLYRRYVGISIRSQMQYRASFAMLTAGHFLITFIEFLGLWAMVARFGSLRGWSLPEVAFLYGLIHTAFAVTEAVFRGFDTFDRLVKSGDFDRLLLRPQPTAFQVAAREVQLFRSGRLIQGLVILVWAASALEVSWTPGRLLLLAWSLAGTTALFGGLYVFQATLAFWTVESLELMNVLSYGGVEAGSYPLAIYRPWFRVLFTWVVPLGCVQYLLAAHLLGRGVGVAVGLLPWLPAAGFGFLVVALLAWRVGVRHYTSTGS